MKLVINYNSVEYMDILKKRRQRRKEIYNQMYNSQCISFSLIYYMLLHIRRTRQICSIFNTYVIGC